MNAKSNTSEEENKLVVVIFFLFHSWKNTAERFFPFELGPIILRGILFVALPLVIYLVLRFSNHNERPFDCFFIRLHLIAPFALPLLLDVMIFSVYFFLKGYKKQQRINAYNDHFKKAGIKSSFGHKPIIIEIRQIDELNVDILLSIRGLSPSSFEEKKEVLKTFFNYKDIHLFPGPKPSLIILRLSDQSLPEMVHFNEVKPLLKQPFSFCVGKSMNKMIIHQITKIPHLSIAGTTQSGKSVMMKQILAGLISSSNHLQIFGIDMKGGVELGDFEGFPNVSIYRDLEGSLEILQRIEVEMNTRCEWMAQNKVKLIEPYKHEFDLIVLVIDEASMLFTPVNKKDPRYEFINQARNSTINISKLGRAMGIHLIVATQKISKDSIDTRIQENLDGRIGFKSNTPEGSSRALGSTKAKFLPAIRGRGFWKYGLDEILFQGPYISDEEIEELKVKEIERFSNQMKKIRSFIQINDDDPTKIGNDPHSNGEK